MKHERPDHPAVPIADLFKRVRILEASTLSAVRATAAPAPSSGPVQIGGGNVGSVYEYPGTYQLGSCGFLVPAGGGSISVVGSITFETHWWNNDTEADAWLEIAGVLASSRSRVTGNYLDVITVAKEVDATLDAGQYLARWQLALASGNQVRVTGGSVAVWIN